MTISAPKPSMPWTNRTLLAWTTQHFTRNEIDHPRLAAEMLLGHVLQVPRLTLYTESDRPASGGERAAFRALVERASRHEPVDYLVGHSPFFTMEMIVNSDVLIPRPSTETLVEHVLQRVRTKPPHGSIHVADIGTGSGAMAVALACHLDDCRVVATDISEPALAVAHRNAEKHGAVEWIDFRCGDLYDPLGDERFDYVLCNPPYIDDVAWAEVAPNVKDYEPHLALRAGTDGMRFIRPVVLGAERHLARDGQLLVEIAAAQEREVLELALRVPGLSGPKILPDHERLPRVMVADVAPTAGIRINASPSVAL